MPSDASAANPKRLKRRRHGYRGYGSPLRREHTGAIHWGQGFAGVGFPEEGGILPRRPGLIPEQLRERLALEDGDPNRRE